MFDIVNVPHLEGDQPKNPLVGDVWVDTSHVFGENPEMSDEEKLALILMEVYHHGVYFWDGSDWRLIENVQNHGHI
jgi:hypothetical protein